MHLIAALDELRMHRSDPHRHQYITELIGYRQDTATQNLFPDSVIIKISYVPSVTDTNDSLSEGNRIDTTEKV